MDTVSLRVIQGLERGETYSDLRVPITIGREEDNAIQLNDERISRCHVKIQRDSDRIILTDLDSTNGTRVNGLPVHMTVLRPGDLITVGRCVLLFGSQEEIAAHCDELHKQCLRSHRLFDDGKTLSDLNVDDVEGRHEAADMDPIGLFDEHGYPAASFPEGRPPLPRIPQLAVRSELADYLSYVHMRILRILEARGLNQADNPQTPSGGQEGQTKDESSPPEDFARIPWPLWNQLLELEVELAESLRKISEPD